VEKIRVLLAMNRRIFTWHSDRREFAESASILAEAVFVQEHAYTLLFLFNDV
jgi:hypothetical protein